MSIHERLGYNFPHEHTIIQLANTNCTCYINSVLQSLFNVPKIQQYLEDVERILNEKNAKDIFSGTLFCLFVKIYIDSQRAPQNEVYYEPNYFLDKLFSISKTLVRGQMGDSFEFFWILINQFDKEIRQINQSLCGPSEILIHPFSDHFKFGISSRRNPAFPAYPYPLAEEFVSSMPILMNNQGIEAAIDEWKVNPYLREIRTLPNVLVLKLMVFNVIDGVYRKDFTKVPIPIELTLKSNGARKEEAAYELISTVMHLGDENGGHYISVFKACDRIIVGDDANFWALNDEQFEKFLDLNEIPGSEQCSAPCILFYHKMKM